MQIFRVVRRYGLGLALGLAVIGAMILPLNLLTLRPFHHDEALYATWGLTIASGEDFWLSQTLIDKPPLFLYVTAGALRLLGATETAARTPSLLAAGAVVLLTFQMGRSLYETDVGLLAAGLVALSPFGLMFAPTAFTDPLLMALVLAACLAAVTGRAGWAGVGLGLAMATKQQGLFFLPLMAGLLAVRAWETSSTPRSKIWAHAGLGLSLTLLPALLWDVARQQPSAFFERSLTNYGGLALNLPGFAERGRGFVTLLAYGTGSSILNGIFLAGLPLLLLADLWQWRRQAKLFLVDGLLTGFSLAFLLLHALFSFQVWDRYLLGLMPLLALLLARVLLLPGVLLAEFGPPISPLRKTVAQWLGGLALVIGLAFLLAQPVQNAVAGRYPLGSNSRALQGIEQVTAYLQGNVGANTTLYHRWLGAHWRFYLGRYPYDLQYWQSPAALVGKAKPGHLIAIPTWRSETEIRIALFKAGFRLHELMRAYRRDGTPSIILYRIEPATTSDSAR